MMVHVKFVFLLRSSEDRECQGLRPERCDRRLSSVGPTKDNLLSETFPSTDSNTLYSPVPNQMTDMLECGSDGSAYRRESGSSDLSCASSSATR